MQLADSYWANLFTLLLKCYVAAAAAAAYHPSKFTPTFHEKLRITTVRVQYFTLLSQIHAQCAHALDN